MRITREQAIALFGGYQPLAEAIEVTPGRISQWPAEGPLPQRDSDRVLGAALRLGLLRAKVGVGEAGFNVVLSD